MIRGKCRGNGSQLADYLLKPANNDNVRVFDIRGTSQSGDLKKSLLEMSLTSELTKTNRGLYHVQICPAYGDDRQMTHDDWIKAAEILEEERGFQGQKRVMVLHEKKGRVHMHVVYERYDHEKGIMKSDKFSRLAQNRARIRMEIELDQQRTPVRNKHRPELKKELTRLWQETTTAQEFISAVEKKGYAVAAGTQRPYMIVDHTGISFNLARQIDGIRQKDITQRFKAIKLIPEKQAIQAVRIRQDAERMNAIQEDSIDRIMLQQEKRAIRKEAEHANDNEQGKAVANDNDKPAYSMTASFTISQKDMEKEKIAKQLKEARLKKARTFRENEQDM